MRFQLVKGQPLKGGAMFITAGSIVDDVSGVFRVTYAPDRSHVGEALPGGWIVPVEAVPLDQTAYSAMRARYPNRQIITHNDALAGITRTADL